MEGVEDLEVQTLKNSPAYGAWNVSIVAAGTGEALPGPVTCGVCCRNAVLYNRLPREVSNRPGGRRRRS
jgi:hypothetical protein